MPIPVHLAQKCRLKEILPLYSAYFTAPFILTHFPCLTNSRNFSRLPEIMIPGPIYQKAWPPRPRPMVVNTAD